MSMQHKIHYVSWHTWLPQSVSTPWPFWYLKSGDRYRHCVDGTEIDHQTVANAFLSKNKDLLNKIEEEYISDVILMAFVDAASQDAAKQQVANLFPDAEFIKIQTVDPVQKQEIEQLIHSLVNTGS